MGRFSCFYGHVHGQRNKKSSQPSFDMMVKTLQLGSRNQASAPSEHKVSMVGTDDDKLGNGTEFLALSARGWKSGEYRCDCEAESNSNFAHFEMGSLRRSFSEGCELNQKERAFSDNNSDDCVDQGFSCGGSHDCNDIAELSTANFAKSLGNTLPDQDQEALQSVSADCSTDNVNHESVFFVRDPDSPGKGSQGDSHVPSCSEFADGYGGQTPTQSMMSKSYSMPNFGSTSPTSPGLSPPLSGNRSVEGSDMDGIKEHISACDDHGVGVTGLKKDDSFCQYEQFDGDNACVDNYDSFGYGCSSKDWILPVPDEIGIVKEDLGGSSSNHWADFPNQDFKIKRIEDWVTDVQHCGPVEETVDIGEMDSEARRSSAFSESINKAELKLNSGMEAAKKYVSSLNAASSTAQLSNHGLVAIPLLSAFVSLRVLNLSGNSIVRITAGALPRGLHMLNLSKNKLSTIEGLRELTRLRVLDLSYNKISRIGHGLASCSSLKELYLAGNKISEVEGLHRLLKLAVLDLRFNKIATSKSLGQLAANYNSLQAISLEGNPAQKNVGDEQLKKFLQGLLQNLAYYNRQHIKTSTLKDSSDRSVRLGISAHQFDRGARSDHKTSSRRGSHGSSIVKRSSHSSLHGQKGQSSDAVKQSRGKYGLLPTSGSKMSQNHSDIGNMLLNWRVGLSLHKSRSESTLAAV